VNLACEEKICNTIVISNYETMWPAHGSQVIDHMTRNTGKMEACLAGGILYTQACSKGWKIRINRVMTGHDEKSVVVIVVDFSILFQSIFSPTPHTLFILLSTFFS
jgi:hypothetical protein